MEKGKFSGTFRGEFIPGTNLFKLNSYIRYDSPKKWPIGYSDGGRTIKSSTFTIPRGTIIDGASIPKAFWSITGGPYTGKYRKSSAIHDILCVSKELRSDDTHELWEEMIYSEGCRNPRRAMMAKAVQWFGPKWKSHL